MNRHVSRNVYRVLRGRDGRARAARGRGGRGRGLLYSGAGRRGSGAIAALSLTLLLPCAAAARDGVELPTGDVQARIVNGTPTSGYPAVGLLLSGSSLATASMACSGTMIGCKTFITAAHCVCPTNGAGCQPPNDPLPGGRLVLVPHAGVFTVSKVFVHPDYQFLSRFSRADLAIVQLGVNISGVRPFDIPSAPTPAGTPGTIVGFGRTGGGSKNTDYGIKRVGMVTTDACNSSTKICGGDPAVTCTVNADCVSAGTTGPCDDGLTCWNFFGPGSNTCNGDSGGPLFADLGSGEVLVGVTSGGASSSCLPNDHSFDSDVGFYHDWIVSTASYETLGSQACGSGSQAGDANNLEDGVTGSLAGCHLSGLHEFLIANGSTQLRVAMTAKDDDATDFDYLVKRGAPPTDTPGGFDCKQDDTGQFGFCQFANPGGGRWFVRVNRFAGSGEYQLTVNNRNTQPAACGNALREPDEDCDGVDDDACEGLCQGDCTCPAPQCGNGVAESGEECDVGADAACPGRCDAQCACACIQDYLEVQRVIADEDRLFIKAVVDSSGGEYDDFNPSDGFRIYLSDGVNTAAVELPAGDEGWNYSNCEKRHFKWKGDHEGTTFVRVTDKTATSGVILLKVRGEAVPGADLLMPGPLSVEAHLDGTCTTGTSP